MARGRGGCQAFIVPPSTEQAVGCRWGSTWSGYSRGSSRTVGASACSADWRPRRRGWRRSAAASRRRVMTASATTATRCGCRNRWSSARPGHTRNRSRSRVTAALGAAPRQFAEVEPPPAPSQRDGGRGDGRLGRSPQGAVANLVLRQQGAILDAALGNIWGHGSIRVVGDLRAEAPSVAQDLPARAPQICSSGMKSTMKRIITVTHQTNPVRGETARLRCRESPGQ